MLSQLTKTIKMALKSTEEERAILRARSAIQRFPVIEWRQRIEDLHRRSIVASRATAGPNAWKEHDGTDSQSQARQPSETEHFARSDCSLRVFTGPYSTPASSAQWSRETLTPRDTLTPSPRHSFHVGGPHTSFSKSDDDDCFNHRGTVGADRPHEFENFLGRANRTIAKGQRHAPDPFFDGATARPSFGAHSRTSSAESIAFIVDEKSNSSLNRAMASVSKPFIFLKSSHS